MSLVSYKMSIGGYVKSGESYDGAFRRELKEELNMDLDMIQCVELGKLSPYKTHISSFTAVYVVYTDETSLFNTNDFSEASWVKPKDLIEKLKNGESAKSDLQPILEAFLLTF